MDEETIQTALEHLSLGGLRYFEQIGSTNDIALAWAKEKDVRDFSLVVANEQTAGRGRAGRKWQTPPDSALALSLLLLPNSREAKQIVYFTALGALALTTALKERYALKAEIKWPNDVLINGRKTAGILVEASWQGDIPKAIVLGMGVNIRPTAMPPASELNFPATSLEDALKKPLKRLEMLREILEAIVKWRPLLGREEMVTAWNENLAFRGQQVEVHARGGQVFQGKIVGINPDGSLRLDSAESIRFGDVHLRPTRV